MFPDLLSILILKALSHSKETLLLDLQQVTSHLATDQISAQNATVGTYPLKNPLMVCLRSNRVVVSGLCSWQGQKQCLHYFFLTAEELHLSIAL